MRPDREIDVLSDEVHSLKRVVCHLESQLDAASRALQDKEDELLRAAAKMRSWAERMHIEPNDR